MAVPTHLYKYERFSAQSIENLKNQVIFFASPKHFNDPYDCALCPTIEQPGDGEVEGIRAHYLARESLGDRARVEFETKSIPELRAMLLRIGQKVLDDEVQRFLTQRGVSCFAERPDNLLMWSHYSEHHRGFCLEFRTDREPFTKIKQVLYSDRMPHFSLHRMLCERDFEQILELFCTKSTDWQYEREWRCMHNVSGTAYTYPSESLVGVYFGPEASFTSLEVIALILAGQNEHVKLWKGSRSKTNFSVNFEAVNYTSHLEAKRRGLL